MYGTLLPIRQAVFEIRGERDVEGNILTNVLKKVRRSLSRHSPHRHIIQTFNKDGYEYSYHATKGWRRNKI